MSNTSVVHVLAWAALGLLSACQSYAPPSQSVGQSASQLIQHMGPPTASHALSGGATRLEFARGPMGKHTYMADVDDKGRVTAVNQVLTEHRFNALSLGMSREAVLREIGHPSHVQWLSYQKRQLWSYRFESPFCLWFQVSLDTAQTVVDLGYGTDPACEVNDRSDGS